MRVVTTMPCGVSVALRLAESMVGSMGTIAPAPADASRSVPNSGPIHLMKYLLMNIRSNGLKRLFKIIQLNKDGKFLYFHMLHQWEVVYVCYKRIMLLMVVVG